MKRYGMHALDFHGPALVEGALTYLRGARYAKQVVALCFLPYPGIVPAVMIDEQAQGFHDVDATLLIVASGARPLHRLWTAQARPRTAVLADFGGRLHRAFGVAAMELAQRCHTCVIDRSGRLRLRVSHDFIERDLAVLRDVIGTSRDRIREGLVGAPPAYLPA